MKPFRLEPSMVTMRGAFYPTGYMVLMFPTEQDARDAVKMLQDAHLPTDEVSLVTPQVFREEIVRTLDGGSEDESLPSAGTEDDTVRRFAELAGSGHHALFIRAHDSAESDRVMAALKGSHVSWGQRYRKLVIEDLVE